MLTEQDLIDAGSHEKSAIDRAKYELHMRWKAATEEEARQACLEKLIELVKNKL